MNGRTLAAPDPGQLRRDLKKVSPQDANGAFNAALKALKQGMEPEGLQLMEAARRVHPRDPRLWQVTGLLHRSLEELEPAVHALGKAAKLASKDPLIAHGLARAHFEAGLPSVHLFRAAGALAPQDGDLLLGLAAALHAENKSEAAIGELDRLLIRNPGWHGGHDAITRIRWQAGEHERFTASFDRALADYPKDLSLWRGLILTLARGNLHNRVLSAIASGRAAAGDNIVFDANEAVSQSEVGNVEEAEKQFARLGHIEDATLQLQRVRHLLRTGRAQEAAALALHASQGPAAHLFWPYLSVAWRLLGDSRWEWLEGDPRLVGVYDLGDSVGSLPRLAERLRSLHVSRSQPLEQSVRGGTQTDGALFARIEPEIRTLRRAIVNAVEKHVAQLPPPDPRHPTLAAARAASVRFAGSWSVRLLAEGHHSNHIHPAGWFSSAFYVTLPGEEERGPHPAGWLALGAPQAELGVELPPVRLVEPKPGRLVLFPSTMWHGTVPFGAGERMTVAFDVAPPR